MKTALLLIDIQNMYFIEGCMRLDNPEKAVKNAGKLLAEFRRNNMPIIHIKHRFNTEGFGEDGEFLCDIHKSVCPMNNETVLEKNRPNSFYGTGLKEVLDGLGVKKLVVAGMMSHMCVDTTVRAAQDMDYTVILADDACADKALEFNGKIISAEVAHSTFMAALGEGFAEIMKTNDIIAGISEI